MSAQNRAIWFLSSPLLIYPKGTVCQWDGFVLSLVTIVIVICSFLGSFWAGPGRSLPSPSFSTDPHLLPPSMRQKQTAFNKLSISLSLLLSFPFVWVCVFWLWSPAFLTQILLLRQSAAKLSQDMLVLDLRNDRISAGNNKTLWDGSPQLLCPL